MKDVLNTAKAHGLRENEAMGKFFNGREMGGRRERREGMGKD